MALAVSPWWQFLMMRSANEAVIISLGKFLMFC